MNIIKILCVVLIISYPIAWNVPILKTSYLGLIYFREISVIDLITSLWLKDWVLSLILVIFSILSPMIKVIYLFLQNFGLISKNSNSFIFLLNKVSMTEIFVISIYIVLLKDLWIKELDVAWGIYLYTLCGLLSLSLSFLIEIKSFDRN